MTQLCPQLEWYFAQFILTKRVFFQVQEGTTTARHTDTVRRTTAPSRRCRAPPTTVRTSGARTMTCPRWRTRTVTLIPLSCRREWDAIPWLWARTPNPWSPTGWSRAILTMRAPEDLVSQVNISTKSQIRVPDWTAINIVTIVSVKIRIMNSPLFYWPSGRHISIQNLAMSRTIHT